LCRDYLKQKPYFASIEKIKKDKEIILDFDYGGLGDVLAFTTLPRLLKEHYGISFYLSPQSLKTVRHKDVIDLCFTHNPFFCGIKESISYFKFKGFASELSLKTFITGKGGVDVIRAIEKQFDLKGRGVPELYYTPQNLPEYHDVILVDKNYISGKRMGWLYKDTTFEKEIKKHTDSHTTITYVDPSKQNLFEYTNMIYSCKHFITVLSGGAVLAASFNKPFTVVLPYNTVGGSVEQFIFRKSKGQYII